MKKKKLKRDLREVRNENRRLRRLVMALTRAEVLRVEGVALRGAADAEIAQATREVLDQALSPSTRKQILRRRRRRVRRFANRPSKRLP